MPNKKTRLPIPQYSYRQNLKKEDLKVYRRIALIIVAFFAILLIIWFMGTNFLNTLELLSQGTTSENEKTTSSQDQPLLTPTIDSLPEAINQDTITVSGQTSADIEVKLFINTKETAKITSDSSGSFHFEKVKLNSGSNLIKVIATNKNKESEEATTNITLDKTKPTLVINGPVDGASLPQSSKTVNVNGVTEPDAIVHISGNQAIVESSGKFSYNLPVTPGANSIEINSVDSAGNATIIQLNVTVEEGVIPDGPSQ